MMDYALLAVGMLVIMTVGACAYGQFFVRDGLDDLKQQVAGLTQRIANLPPPPDPPPPVDVSALEERVGFLLTLMRELTQPRDQAKPPEPSPSMSPRAETTASLKVGVRLLEDRLKQKAQG